jgi:SAM-dependent methyltransferase
MVPAECADVMVPDAAALAAAWRYAVLQPLVVDKGPLFRAMIRLVELGGVVPGRVVELGVGTGGFLEAVARAGVWPGASLVGADVAVERLMVARETLAALGRSAMFCDGVNALDAGDPFYVGPVPAGSADVVVMAQFEHYAANGPESGLARRREREGRVWCTKAALRRLAWARLRPGGWLFVIDDYAAGSAELQARWDRAWDAHVVRQLTGERVRGALQAHGLSGAAWRGGGYDPGRPWSERLALAARVRRRRRHRDGEEVQPWSDAFEDFRVLGGAGGCGLMPHPAVASHPQFFLMWARRAAG